MTATEKWSLHPRQRRHDRQHRLGRTGHYARTPEPCGPGSPFFPAARIPGPDPERASYNSYASFEDPDGNGWTLQEITTRLPGREPEE
jgi:hypothetical protein